MPVLSVTSLASMTFEDPDGVTILNLHPDYRDHFRVLAVMLYPDDEGSRFQFETGRGEVGLELLTELKYQQRVPNFSDMRFIEKSDIVNNLSSSAQYQRVISNGFAMANLVWYFIFAKDKKYRNLACWQEWLAFRRQRIIEQQQLKPTPKNLWINSYKPETSPFYDKLRAKFGTRAPLTKVARPKAKLSLLPSERTELKKLRERFVSVAHLWAVALTFDGCESRLYPSIGTFDAFVHQANAYFAVIEKHVGYASLLNTFDAQSVWSLELDGVKNVVAEGFQPAQKAPISLLPSLTGEDPSDPKMLNKRATAFDAEYQAFIAQIR